MESESFCCAFAGCGRPVKARGHCRTHYSQLLANQPLRPIKTYRPAGATLVRDDQGRKQCGRCLQWKHLCDFSISGKCLDGVYAWCKLCLLARNRERRYGLEVGAIGDLLLQQDFACAICSAPIDATAHVDHDHKCCSGERSCGACVRGLLCAPCNWGLGHFRDNPRLLGRALAYLGKYTLVGAA